LPASIGKLQNLETLSLFNNQIEGQIPNALFEAGTLKIVLLNSNKLSGKLSADVSKLSKLENLSLFENNLDGQVPFDLEKLNNLKEMNISYNMFSGLVSRKLAVLDTLNMTMVNDKGVAVLMDIKMDNTRPLVSED
jgi:Leucine-rich repeat (LRR) protein